MPRFIPFVEKFWEYSKFNPSFQRQIKSRSHVKPELADVDWEAERLTATESFYAALSVFAIGQIYRQLRHWHALPKRCIKCRQELGFLITFF